MSTIPHGSELNPIAVPPHDAGAEQDVLGCLLIDPKLIVDARAIIDVADFWTEPGRIVFQAVIDAARAVPDHCDYRAVIREIEHVGAIERIGGKAFLQACIERIADATNIPAYCRVVKSCSNRRKVMDAAGRAQHAALTGADYEGTLREVVDALQASKPGRADDAGPVMRCMADVQPTPVSWLWRGRIPLGRITLLVGRPGEGKSFLTTDMASRITTGTPWPDGSECPQGSVILVSAEDDPGDTIRPRLDAHGADASRVHLLSAVRRQGDHGKPYETMFSLADLPALEAALQRVPDCKLIVIDPIGSFLGGKTDAHRDNEVRGVLAPVAKLAEKYGPAVLIVAHRRKGAGDFADDTALGSRAFTGIARATWHLSRDKEDKARRLLLPGKNNLGPEGSGLAFSIGGEPAAVHWERDPVSMSADEGMAIEAERKKPGPDADSTNAACAWLRNALADGPCLASNLTEEAKEGEGIAKRTLDRARKNIGIIAYRLVNPGPWWWRLPGYEHIANASKGRQLGNVAMCQNPREKQEILGGGEAHCQVGLLGNVPADPTGWGVT